MGIETLQTDVHWNYFLAIERDLEALSRYIEFHEDNFKCFSIELARIILSASAEVDVVCKLICRAANVDSQADGINDYHREIKIAFPNICDFQVRMPRFKLGLKPWDEWHSALGVPIWWTAYNKVKHHRDTHYCEANLKNALNAVAGLFVVTIYLYKNKTLLNPLIPGAQLFEVDPKHVGGRRMSGGEVVYRF